jgi:hypothetical protein
MDCALLHRQAEARKIEHIVSGGIRNQPANIYSDIFSCIIVEQSIFIVFPEL